MPHSYAYESQGYDPDFVDRLGDESEMFETHFMEYLTATSVLTVSMPDGTVETDLVPSSTTIDDVRSCGLYPEGCKIEIENKVSGTLTSEAYNFTSIVATEAAIVTMPDMVNIGTAPLAAASRLRVELSSLDCADGVVGPTSYTDSLWSDVAAVLAMDAYCSPDGDWRADEYKCPLVAQVKGETAVRDFMVGTTPMQRESVPRVTAAVPAASGLIGSATARVNALHDTLCSVYAAMQAGSVYALEDTLIAILRDATERFAASASACKSVPAEELPAMVRGTESIAERLMSSRLSMCGHGRDLDALSLAARVRIGRGLTHAARLVGEWKVRGPGLCEFGSQVARGNPKHSTNAKLSGYIVMPPGTGKTTTLASEHLPNVIEADQACNFRRSDSLMRLRKAARATGEWASFNAAWVHELRHALEPGRVILVPDAEIGELLGAQYLGTVCLNPAMWVQNLLSRGDHPGDYKQCYNRATCLTTELVDRAGVLTAVKKAAGIYRPLWDKHKANERSVSQSAVAFVGRISSKLKQ